MLKKVTFYIFILMLLPCAKAQQDAIHLKKYSIQALNKDVEILKAIILVAHPSIGYYHSEDWYKQYFDTSLQIHQSYTEKEFRMFLKRKLEALHCGHTNIRPSRRYAKYLRREPFHVIPYYMIYSHPYLITVKGITKTDTIFHTNDTIVAIDNKPVSEYAKIYKQYLYVDGDAIEARDEMLQKNFIFYHSSFYDKDSFLMTHYSHQKMNIVNIKTKKFKQLNNILWQMTSDTLIKKYKKKYYAGKYLDTHKNIFYIKIKAFSGVSMNKFLKKTFKTLHRNNTKVLILDLRNNPGGKISQSLNLLSYLLPQGDSLFYETRIHQLPHKKSISHKLEYHIIKLFMRFTKHRIEKNIYIEKIKKKKRYHFDEKVYVIVNCNTFSAANLVAVYLSQKRANTKIVGLPSSGVQWGSNAVSFLRITLPHTKIKILLPTYRIYHNLKHTERELLNKPVYPDIPRVDGHSVEYFLHKEDGDLKAIYFDLKSITH